VTIRTTQLSCENLTSIRRHARSVAVSVSFYPNVKPSGFWANPWPLRAHVTKFGRRLHASAEVVVVS